VRLTQTCAGCGFQNPDNAKFCNNCGSTLVPLPAPKKKLTVEKKVGIAALVCLALVISGVVASTLSHPSNPTSSTKPVAPSKSWHVVADYGGPSGPIKDTNTTFQIRGNQSSLHWSYNTEAPDSAIFTVTIYYPTHNDIEAVCLEGTNIGIPDPNCRISYCYLGDCQTNYSGNLLLNLSSGEYKMQTISDIGSWHVSISDYF
jgi:hypothetical protein